ncbi:DeoR/GlpR family DNA-binding transcription regulator [Paenibacillus sp. N3.4]|uniref:DeoR/GlpR family DNA-binding transcription regulator n=1 Tax=Paenibacillus sp. N3.4 TaxID=2603222 RepID=UPI0011C8E489|nr:DeoR/GlpR family DNA-binding transcription regulator [Paenibacillus sp. N3.4]TXK86178.1 DeoR/GlpR transcriptional regulator [Paenibacillus sp. N3.4]
MYQEERLNKIVDYLKQHGRVSIQDICHFFGVSRDTARRDLLRMEEMGLVIRTHGGAILPKQANKVHEYRERLVRESEEKHRIGAFAASLVNNGDFILMDASTTVQFAAEHLTSTNVVVVTNSIDNVDVLSKKPAVRTYLLGGELHPQHRFLFGQATIDKLRDYQVDKLFLGACSITPDGLFYLNEDDGFVKREMIKRANQIVVLADHTKFGAQMFFRVCGLEAIDLLITDKQPEQAFVEIFQQNNVELLIVSEKGMTEE